MSKPTMDLHLEAAIYGWPKDKVELPPKGNSRINGPKAVQPVGPTDSDPRRR